MLYVQHLLYSSSHTLHTPGNTYYMETIATRTKFEMKSICLLYLSHEDVSVGVGRVLLQAHIEVSLSRSVITQQVFYLSQQVTSLQYTRGYSDHLLEAARAHLQYLVGWTTSSSWLDKVQGMLKHEFLPNT